VRAPENPYLNFSSLPGKERGKIIWNLNEQKEWGKLEHKPIVVDILTTQAPYSANSIAYVTQAIQLTRKYDWKDLNPLIQKIYDNPSNIWVYEEAFLYLRGMSRDDLPEDFTKAWRALAASGGYGWIPTKINEYQDAKED
jgi:hypothetical protein